MRVVLMQVGRDFVQLGQIQLQLQLQLRLWLSFTLLLLLLSLLYPIALTAASLTHSPLLKHTHIHTHAAPPAYQ